MVPEVLPVEKTLEQRLKNLRDGSGQLWGSSVLGRGKGKIKDLEAQDACVVGGTIRRLGWLERSA